MADVAQNKRVIFASNLRNALRVRAYGVGWGVVFTEVFYLRFVYD